MIWRFFSLLTFTLELILEFLSVFNLDKKLNYELWIWIMKEMFVLQRRLIQDFLLKRSSKEKKYHFTWILKRFMVSKNFHVTSFQYWCHVSQTYQTFQIFGKIITRCRLIEIQQNVTFEIEGHFLSIFLRNFSFPVLTEKHNLLNILCR